MRRTLMAHSALFSLLLAGHAAAEARVGDYVAFVTCPIAQDLGPEEDLCFFAEHRGERFSLQTQAFDSTGPMLRHKMLVEGRVTDGPRECGGLRLEGMTSSLPEITLECNEVRPFEDRFAPPSEAGPGRLADLVARMKAEPEISVRPVDSGVPDFAGPAPRSWEMLYTFDSDRGDGPSLQALVALVQAAAKQPGSIAVHGYRGASRLESGQVMEEPAAMARQRAEKIAGIIAGLGYPKSRIKVAWTDRAARPDGRDDWRRRRVTVQVED